jgi:hypothetical protein
MADHVICCSEVFKVKASVYNDDIDLKMLIFEIGKNNMFCDINAPNLIL